MKKLALVFVLLSGIAMAATMYDADNFSALGRLYQPKPAGYAVGKDNGPGRGMHHPGEDCARCHSMGLRAESHLWTMAGTLFQDRVGSVPLKRGEVILQDRDGNVLSMTSNGSGNFWTTSPLASNPYTVVNHGSVTDTLYSYDSDGNFIPADPTDERTWLYKGWVGSGGAVRPMVTIAPVGSASGMSMRMSCSMHHAQMGSRGALWVASAPTLGDYPRTQLSYRKHIYPILRSKCSPCHIPGATITRLVTKSDLDTPSTSLDYSSGLDLMTYEGSNVGNAVKKGVCAVVDPDHPEKSVLLIKTAKGGTHGGGAFWDRKSPDYLALRQWISEGAMKN